MEWCKTRPLKKQQRLYKELREEFSSMTPWKNVSESSGALTRAVSGKNGVVFQHIADPRPELWENTVYEDRTLPLLVKSW